MEEYDSAQLDRPILLDQISYTEWYAILEDALAAVRVDIRALRYINTTPRELGEGFTRHVARQVRIADCP